MALLLATFGLALGLHGYASSRADGVGIAQATGDPTGGLDTAGPVLDLSGGTPRSVRPPERTVVLTFEDGPDPRWTPEVLELLRRHDAPATFFVLGTQAAEHPELIRAVLDDGHDVGSHLFSHVELSAVSDREADLQLSLAQLSLAGSGGIRTALFRPPFSSLPGTVTADQLTEYRRIADKGYVIVLSDRDSDDWHRPGVDRIVANARPDTPHGAVLLFHDGGGDRSETLAALDRLLPELKRAGYRFETVSQLVGRERATINVPVEPGDRFQGRGLVAALKFAGWLATGLQALLVPIGSLAVARLAVAVWFARRHARRRAKRRDVRTVTDPVSIVVPAYNEEAGIEAAVRSLARSDHPELEILVVDDGSTDRTAEIVRHLALPGVRLIRRPNGGKPAALNTGIAAATHDLIVTVDGDTIFEPHTLGELVQAFADPTVGAVSGNTKVGNRRGLLGRWQHIEYVMGFNLDRRTFEELNCMPTVPGAIGAFRRAALTEVGGISGDTLAEDTDVTMAINRAGWRVAYEDRALAWTEAPATLSGLWRQRYRWSYGTMQAMWKHRGAVFDREHTRLGRRALLYLLCFQVLLPVLAPLIDLYAIYGVVFLNPLPVLGFWLVFNLLGIGIAAYSFRLDREPLRPLWSLPLQQFFYRQIMYLVVIQSVITAVAGARLPWQRIEREGSAGDALPAPEARPQVRPATRPGA